MLLYSSLFVIAQLITLAVAYTALRTTAVERIKQQLISANTLFQQQLIERAHYESEFAKILSADFGFREAIASNDLPTMYSSILNLTARTQADRAMLISLDNQIPIDTDSLFQS